MQRDRVILEIWMGRWWKHIKGQTENMFVCNQKLVIVLIIYIRTLAANEKFKNLKSYWGLSILLVPFILKVPINLSHFKISSSMVSILSLYHYSNFSLLVFLILYLLLALVCVVKLIKFEAGPLIKRL